MRIFLLLLTLAVLLPIPDIFAQEERITWEESVREAKRNNPDMLAAQAQLKGAEARMGGVRANLLPQLSGSASAGRSKSSGDEASDSYSYGLSASQLIFDGLKSWYDLERSEQSLVSSRLDYDLTSATLRRNLRRAFIALLEAQELVGITEDIRGRRRQQAELVRLRYEAGREHRGALLTAEANLARAEFDVAQARRDVELAQQGLHKELGRKEFSSIRADGSLDLTIFPRDDPELDDLLERHPSVLKSATQLEGARLEVKTSRGDFFPELSGRASISRSDSEWPPEEERWSLSLNLSLPLFQGGRRGYDLSGARAALREAEENYRGERDETLFSLEEAWKDFRDAWEEVGIQQKFLDADQERSRIAEAQYSSGLLAFDNWIIIEDNLVRTKKALLRSRAAALNAEATWIYAFGGSLDFGFEKPMDFNRENQPGQSALNGER